MSQARQIADECTAHAPSVAPHTPECASRRAAFDARFSKVDDLVERLTQDTQIAAKSLGVAD